MPRIKQSQTYSKWRHTRSDHLWSIPTTLGDSLSRTDGLPTWPCTRSADHKNTQVLDKKHCKDKQKQISISATELIINLNTMKNQHKNYMLIFTNSAHIRIYSEYNSAFYLIQRLGVFSLFFIDLVNITNQPI